MADRYAMPRVIYHPRYQAYDLGPEHPFNPVRVQMVLELLAELGVGVDPLLPDPVTPDELLAVHDESYVRAVEAASASGEVPEGATFGLGTPDNPVVAGMAEAARLIAGGTRLGAELIASGEAKQVLQLGGGFHHAHRCLASGFCLYNDLALAINHLTRQGRHVAYLDIDVHHGDGVQEILFADENVMTISLHESGEYLFPGTGWLHELGQGMGRGLKLNLPLEPFTEGDSYLEIVEEAVAPALAYFHPEVLVLQAGADAHYLDPLADLSLTTQDYERLFRRIVEMAERYAGGRLLVTLGGGYSLVATPRVWTILYLVLSDQALPVELPAEWRRRWQARLGVELPATLHDPNPAFDPIPRRGEIERQNRQQVRRLMDAVAPLWW